MQVSRRFCISHTHYITTYLFMPQYGRSSNGLSAVESRLKSIIVVTATSTMTGAFTSSPTNAGKLGKWPLKWQRVRFQQYKVACLVHQSLAGQTPAYIADDIQLVTESDRRQLRSAAARTCLVPRTHNNFGDRSFNAAGPRVWNSLPPHPRQDMNFARFKRQLKTFLFRS